MNKYNWRESITCGIDLRFFSVERHIIHFERNKISPKEVYEYRLVIEWPKVLLFMYKKLFRKYE